MKQSGGRAPQLNGSNVSKKDLAKNGDIDLSEEGGLADSQQVNPPKNVKMDEVAQKAMRNVVSLIEASGLEHMKDYIEASKLDETKAKYMLCDLFLLVNKSGYFIDFKADKYFDDFSKRDPKSDEKVEIEALKKRLDKYLAYISNPKYSSLIKKLLTALRIQPEKTKVVFAVRNYEDVHLLDKIGYSKKIEEKGVVIMDVNGINDLIL